MTCVLQDAGNAKGVGWGVDMMACVSQDMQTWRESVEVMG